MLALGGILLIVILLAGAYFAVKQLSSRPPTPPGGVGPSENVTPGAPQGGNYSISPLIMEFGISSTPVLVFNCEYLREGTFATKEVNYQLPEGTERQDIINELCMIAGNESSFCAVQRSTVVQGALVTLNRASCPSGAKVRVYAFSSPSCSNSGNQRPILDSIAQDFAADMEVVHVCTPIYEGDAETCARLVASGAYNE